MTNYQVSTASSDIVAQQSESIIPLDEFKSFFYQLNGKPDTEIRLLKAKKILEIADIRSINEQVAAKLENHEITAGISSINFVLSNRKIKDYATWAEFERENWDTVNEKIQTVSIKWDILIKLPKFSLPQRHSMRLRIGGDVLPKDIFQLMMTSDDIAQLIEAQTPSVCKVDFINDIIASELLNIVDNWHQGLKDCPKSAPVEEFFKKKGKLIISPLVRYFVPVLLLTITSIYYDSLSSFFRVQNTISIDSLQKTAVFMIAIFTVGLFLGRTTEEFIDKKVDKLECHPKFSITRGDKKAVEEHEKNNKKITREIINRIFWTVFLFPLTYLLKILADYIAK